MLIIPAIDIIGGRVVRLKKGDYTSQREYSLTPLEQSGIFYENGFNRIHIVDLIGSKEGKISVLDIIKEIKTKYPVAIQFGGGIRYMEDAIKAIEAGIEKIIVGSISVTNRNEFEKIINLFTPERIIVSADVLKDEIMIKGWKERAGVSIYRHLEYCTFLGLNEFLCTDISKDGMLAGPSFELYSSLQERFPDCKFIASGGISSIQDLKKLKEMNLYAAVTGKAIYENKIDLKELKEIAD